MRRHNVPPRHLLTALALAALSLAAAGQTLRVHDSMPVGPVVPSNLPPQPGTSPSDSTAAGPVLPGGMQLSQTYVDVRLFSGDFEQWSKSITISGPQVLTFRWWTFETDAVGAFWQLADAPFTTVNDPGNDPAMVTAGMVAASSQIGHYTQFKVTVFQNMPPSQFNGAHTYYLRMIPVGQGLTLAGLPSFAVTIHLVAPAPPTQFDDNMGLPGGMQRSAQAQPLRPGIQIQFPILRVRERRHLQTQEQAPEQDQPQRLAPASPEQNGTPPALRLRGLRLLGG